MIRLVLFLALFMVSPIAFAAKEECGQFWSKTDRRVRFCFLNHSDAKDLLVYFHGVTNNHRAWGNPLTRGIEKEYRRQGLKLPPALVISFGRLHFLAPRSSSSVTSDEDLHVLAEEVDDLIQRFKTKKALHRTLLLGDSMGSFAALQLFLRRPLIFDQMVLACPPVATISPFSPRSEWRRLGKEAQAWPGLWSIYGQVLRRAFQTPENWLKFAPENYIQKSYQPLLTPQRIHLVSMRRDLYGFTHMHQHLKSLLEGKGHSVTQNFSPGIHCFAKPGPIVEFFESI